MEKVKEIANSIHKNIVVKVDYPSNHENNRLPVLNMEFWIGQVEVNGELKQQILYSHYYMKSVSSRHVIRKDSAISYNTKLNILINEHTRVMRNISPHVATEGGNTTTYPILYASFTIFLINQRGMNKSLQEIEN